MAKVNGLGDNAYVAGYDLSGDVSALSKIGGGPALLDVTGINASAFERIGAVLSGEISFASWFNTALLHEHVALSGLPTADVDLLYARGTTLGNAAAFMRGKQMNYDITRAQGGALSAAVQALSNGYPLFWGVLLTAGIRSDTAATAGTGVDGGSNGSAVTITSASAANPTSVLATAHGLVTGDSVTISGTNKAALNADWAVTVVDANHFTVPCDLTGGAATGGSFLKTSTNFGLTAMHQTFTFTGTSNTPVIKHSADNGVVDAYTTITGASFAAITAAPDTQIIQTATGATIKRYLRLDSVGTFNPSTFACAAMRHLSATI